MRLLPYCHGKRPVRGASLLKVVFTPVHIGPACRCKTKKLIPSLSASPQPFGTDKSHLLYANRKRMVNKRTYVPERGIGHHRLRHGPCVIKKILACRNIRGQNPAPCLPHFMGKPPVPRTGFPDGTFRLHPSSYQLPDNTQRCRIVVMHLSHSSLPKKEGAANRSVRYLA